MDAVAFESVSSPPRRYILRPDNSHDHARQRSGSDPFGHVLPGGFRGKITLVDSEAKALRASLLLLGARTVGLDTESRPSFRRGESYPIALVQIATHKRAFLYRVRPGAPYRSLKRLIENPRVRKIVQGAREEARELRRDLGIEARGFVDLPTAAKAAGQTELNLRALAARVLGIRITKSAQRSNWANPELSTAQIEYAATDAWACLAVYEKLGVPAQAVPEVRADVAASRKPGQRRSHRRGRRGRGRGGSRPRSPETVRP
jgi:ribonuclease D